ncbi:iron complex outermembrane recepter protein [Aeromonas sp. RU39B]|nr:iron complex outermembrane recepter protein [Aeromonas sp. RU39B]
MLFVLQTILITNTIRDYCEWLVLIFTIKKVGTTMRSLRLSNVGLGVLTALSVGMGSVAVAAESTDEQSEAQSGKSEVITVMGSQVDLGDAYEGDQVARTSRAGMLGNMDFMETPFSSTSYTSELIADQQAQSVADVLQNDPTVRVATGFGNFQELYMIRGFPVYSDDMTLNGVYGILPRQFVAAEMLERVEVLRGANTFLNGAAVGGSAIGGSVNLVPKRAGSEPLTRATVGTQSGGEGYAALDTSRRFGENDANGIRVNLVGRGGDGVVDDEKNKLGVIAVGFDHQGDRFRMSADAGYQDHHIDSPRPSVTIDTNSAAFAPTAPDSSSNYAQDWTYTDEKQLFGVVRGEYDLTKQTSVWLAGGARNGKEHNLLANPTVDANGNVSAYLFENVREENVLSADTGLRHEFATGNVGHTVVLSGSAYQLRSKNAYEYANTFTFGSLDNPYQVSQSAAETGLTAGGKLDDPKETIRNVNSSVALADTASMIDDELKITLGARGQRLVTHAYDYNTGNETSSNDRSKLTPFGGVVYQPRMDVSYYANYAESLVATDPAPSWKNGKTITNAGTVFEPFRSKQMEVGAKYDNGQYGAGISAFQITKPSYMISGTIYTDNGEQRNRGIELTAFGKPLEQVKVIGGVTLIDAELTKTENGAQDGNTGIGVPDVMANLNVEWDTPFVPGLTLEGRTIYTSAQYVNADNTAQIPSWTRFDVGARYTINMGNDHTLTLRSRVENLTDKNYWSSVGGYPDENYLVLGSPRTFVLSASYDF